MFCSTDQERDRSVILVASENVSFQLILMFELKNMAALDGLRAKEDAALQKVFGTFFDLLLATIPFCLYSAHTFFPRYRGIHFVSQSYSRSTRREKPFSAYLQSFGDLNGIALLSRTY